MRENTTDEKMIGLIVGGISNEFSKEIIKGITSSIPKKSNIRLAVLPGELMLESFQGDVVTQHNAMFNSIYNLGSICHMDGLIIAMGSIGWALSDDKIEAFLSQYKDIPLVLIASGLENYTTVNYDNKMGISEAINVLATVYGVGCIGMIGGYDENIDSIRRRDIYLECLEESGLQFRDSLYVPSDMSENTEEAAEKLLDDNPDIQAVFCVNDAAAVGLYNVLKRRGLRPGKDIFVFGFDNTRMAAEMVPPLSSIGSKSVTLGQKALELLLKKIGGEEVESTKVPTMLYGRTSLVYERYEFSLTDLESLSDGFINRMFDDCFYRYSNEHITRENINLRRLFYEMISRIFKALKRRYIGMDEFDKLYKLIDIFFSNGAMAYTDVRKFLVDLTRLQTGINRVYRDRDNTLINRLFLRMKDDALVALAEMRKRENDEANSSRDLFRKFLIKSMNYYGDKDAVKMDLLNSFDMLGIQNCVLYEFETPVLKDDIEKLNYPEYLNLPAVVKNGNVYLIPESKQRRPLSEIFIQREIKVYNKQFVTFPVFYEKYFYGIYLCELEETIFNKGEFIASQLGIIIHMNRNL